MRERMTMTATTNQGRTRKSRRGKLSSRQSTRRRDSSLLSSSNLSTSLALLLPNDTPLDLPRQVATKSTKTGRE
jgi:hypothetical protein